MVLVTDELVAQIVEIGKARFPNEACGIIVGAFGEVHEIPNVAKKPQEQYELDGPAAEALFKEYLAHYEDEDDGQIYYDEEGLHGVLVWHTHPSGFVGPSEGDMRHRVAGLRYVVVSLPQDGEEDTQPVAVCY